MSVQFLMQSIVQGLSFGALYALMAFGLVLIYKTMDVVNFANGDVAMISAFITFTLLTKAGWPMWAAILGTIVLAGFLGAGIERVFLRPVESGPAIGMIIVTMGLVMVIQGFALAIFGYNPAYMPPLVTGTPLFIGPVIVTRDALLQVGAALGLSVVLYFLVQRTKLGLAMRAIAQSAPTARLMGIPVNRIYSVTWAIAAMLSSIAGVMVTQITGLHVNMSGEVNLMAFTAAVLGGFSSLTGALVGGLVLGALEGIILMVSPGFKTTLSFALIILILWVKPSGLMGGADRRRV